MSPRKTALNAFERDLPAGTPDAGAFVVRIEIGFGLQETDTYADEVWKMLYNWCLVVMRSAEPPILPPSQGLVVVVSAAVLLTAFVLSSTSILFRAEGTAWSAWCPVCGVAIGYAARFQQRRLWPIAAVMGVVSAAASFVNGREVPLVIWGCVVVAAEV